MSPPLVKIDNSVGLGRETRKEEEEEEEILLIRRNGWNSIISRKIFWSDWNRASPKLEWANEDGTDRAIFLQGDYVKLPNSLSIDWAMDELCMCEGVLSL